MSILVNGKTRLIIQGITGNEGLFHAQRMLSCGTNIVAGVTPGRGGEWVLDGKVPIFDTIRAAKDVSGANASVVFVPARFATDAILESVDALIPLVVCITEGIPVQEMMKVKSYLQEKHIVLIGPNSPGVLSPEESNVGIIPNNLARKGNVGVVSRSGTLTYEILDVLKKNNIGVSTCVGVGGDPILGCSFSEILELFEEDPGTEKIILVGEIGGKDEELAADYIVKNIHKPIVAFIAGQTAPAGRRMGHAGAIIEGTAGSAQEKIRTLREAGVSIANLPEEIPAMLK